MPTLRIRQWFSIAVLLSACLPSIPSYGQDKDQWQQRVNYTFSCILDDVNHTLHADVVYEYINNSPDILEEIHFNVWANAYSHPNTPLGNQLKEIGEFEFYFAKDSDRGYLDSLQFVVNGSAVQHEVRDRYGEHVVLKLPEPLLPTDTVQIYTPFRLKVPKGNFSRLGRVGDSYQFTQWYPKPAVYDENGWHVMPYLTQGEFYSEFGKYEVQINIERSFLIGATGRMSKNVRQELIQQSIATGLIENFGGNDFPPRTRYNEFVLFQQDSIHDFAWFADRRFNVLHDTIILPHSGRVVDAWVLFTNENADVWSKSMEYVKDGTRFYSAHVGDYPYDHVTVVDGTLSAGGGMEYPMVTVINSTASASALERVIVHEIGHNWFYGILASDEREHPWMDEGINSFYEVRYFEEKYGEKQEGSRGLLSDLIPDSRGLNELGYLLTAREHLDQDLHICSHRYTNINYGVMVYSKAAYLMQYLRSSVGTDRFDAAMRKYYESWKFKHPSPSDFRESLENSTGEDLAWFFDQLIQTKAKIDFKVKDYDEKKNELIVHSKTSFEGPVKVGYYKDDELLGIDLLRPNQSHTPSVTGFDKLILDPEKDLLDWNRKNDTYRTKGLLRRFNDLKIRRLLRPGDGREHFIFINPMSAWNDHDKLMTGLNLTNFEALAKDFEWSVSPMYSWHRKDISGLGSIRKRIWLGEESPNSLLIEARAKRFSIFNGNRDPGRYNLLNPSISARIIPKSLKGGRFDVRYGLHLVEERFELVEGGVHFREELYHELLYDYRYDRGLFSTHVDLNFEHHGSFDRLELSLENRFIYNAQKRMWGFRLYGGKFWSDNNAVGGANLSLGGRSGRYNASLNGDYRYEYLLLGRSESSGILSQQHVRDRGGFSISPVYGSSEDWTGSLNLYADLPVPVLMIYGSIGAYQSRLITIDGLEKKTQLLYEGGLRLNIVRDAIDVSFPIFLQADDDRIQAQLDEIKFGQRIRFQFRLATLLDLRSQVFNAVF